MKSKFDTLLGTVRDRQRCAVHQLQDAFGRAEKDAKKLAEERSLGSRPAWSNEEVGQGALEVEVGGHELHVHLEMPT